MPLTMISNLGAAINRNIEYFGRFTLFCLQSIRWFFLDLFNRRRWSLIWPQMYEVGTKSIPVICLTGSFIGMVMAVELFEQFQAFGQESRLGGIIDMSVVRHLGPVLAAIMLAGRVGGAFAAEIGTMAVTEQVDALRVMGASPVGYLVVPRVLACLVMIPIMTIFSDLLGIFGAWVITVGFNHVTNADYWAYSAQFVQMWDLSTGLLKSLFFGLAIGWICCYKGFHCEAGAKGVGRATTDAFVTSFVAIIVLNFFLAKFSKDLYYFIYGHNDVPMLGMNAWESTLRHML
ncbi:MAG: MlaE family lipid ABC transporter permease subunit [Phycisphaera sp.]|nr:MlaE family lipid ABC transporter permease subunit [Phycisphaera sp.]